MFRASILHPLFFLLLLLLQLLPKLQSLKFFSFAVERLRPNIPQQPESRDDCRGICARHFFLRASGADRSDEVERTRLSLVGIMGNSWNNVTQMLPSHALESCESSLKANTALLVLAAIRHSANRFSTSRETFEGMLIEADSNNDGQLSYLEWFDWLRQSGGSDDSSEEVGASGVVGDHSDFSDHGHSGGIKTSGGGYRSSSKGLPLQRMQHGDSPEQRQPHQVSDHEAFIDVDIAVTSIQNYNNSGDSSGTVAGVFNDDRTESSPSATAAAACNNSESAKDVQNSDDPIVTAIDQVLSSAVRTLRVIARMTDDADLLTASFVAGGLLAGNVDDAISSQILVRLPDAIRSASIAIIIMPFDSQ